MTAVPCVTCGGRGLLTVHAAFYDGDNRLRSGIRMVDCDSCSGVGTMTVDQCRRYAKGRDLMLARRAAGYALHKAGADLGVDAVEVSKWERGLHTDEQIAAYQAWLDRLSDGLGDG